VKQLRRALGIEALTMSTMLDDDEKYSQLFIIVNNIIMFHLVSKHWLFINYVFNLGEGVTGYSYFHGVCRFNAYLDLSVYNSIRETNFEFVVSTLILKSIYI
jgi:hypothetical protein